ncbi:MAG: hydantoinase B/oxoprolinase family protein [Acetobacterales bacterium]
MGGLSLGIDIGGTFTDIVLFDPVAGGHYIWKESTTPDDPAEGVIAGIRHLLEREGIAAAEVDRVVHATTLFTNALIERKGAKTGLITTQGFRDTLEIGRERKYELYDIHIEMPLPLVPRPLRLEVPERLDKDGLVEIPLDEDALVEAADRLAAEGVTSIAVTFLHAYADSRHERRARDLIAARHPGLFVTCSHEVAPEIREFERASTTVINAYVRPLAQTYLDRLLEQIRALGIDGPFFMMLSNGGLTHVDEAKRNPVQLLESGPAAGALAAAWFGRTCGEDRLLALDMGGTTAKASLVDDGEPVIAYGFEAAREKRFMEGSGLPVMISTIELIEIGAGGGSIAHVDELGLLKVGPRSSGAMPGPASYGRGGTEPTVTDADLLLGYLDPAFFLGGAMRIDTDAAGAAMRTLSGATGLTEIEVAWGIHDVVNENMASAARVHIAERGKDPRDYALLATGGAGPVHACHVARKLNLGKVVVPPAAGVGSTVGLLMAPARIDRVATLVCRLDSTDWAAVERLYGELEADAGAVLRETGADMDALQVRRFADMRFAGQGAEVVVPLPAGPYDAGSEAAVAEAFEGVYRTLFGRTPPDAAAQWVKLRVSLQAPVSRTDMVLRAEGASIVAALKGRRQVYFPESSGHVETAVYDRYALPPGARVEGPAIVEERESTLVVPPGASFVRRADGTLLVDMPQDVVARGAGTFDAVTLEVLWTRLISCVDEAAAALVRTSFSTLVRESHDFSCILTDERGQSLCQATRSIPAFIGTLPGTVKHFVNEFPAGTLKPGDVLITNDIHQGTGHLPDITVAKPIFRDGALIGFAASTAHSPDIGGKIRSPEPREVFEEGLQIPLMKLMREGVPDPTLVAVLRKNVRVPDQVMGDLWAQVVALELMERRLLALMDAYALTSLRELADEIHGRCETAMRAAIRALPDGVYRSSLKTDGLMVEPVTLEATLTISGDSIEIDYAGSSPQVDRAINCAMCYTYALTVYGMKCVTSPNLPNNEGAFRPLTVKAPAGCIVNPMFPSPGGSRVLVGAYLPVLIFEALGQIVPDRVLGASGSPHWGINQSGVDAAGKPMATMQFFNGGMGASDRTDGGNCLSWPANIASTSVEIAEHITPFRIRHKQLRPDSGGPGRFRGGLGQEIHFESLHPTPIAVSFLAERTRFPAPGIDGGGYGALGVVKVNGEPVDPKRQYVLRRGETVTLGTPGGGGQGDPKTRDRRRIEADLAAGYVTDTSPYGG